MLVFVPALLLVVGNNSSRAAAWLNIKFPVNIVSYAHLDVDETVVTGGMILIFFMSSTSSRLEVDMCTGCWATIHLLLIGRGVLWLPSFALVVWWLMHYYRKSFLRRAFWINRGGQQNRLGWQVTVNGGIFWIVLLPVSVNQIKRKKSMDRSGKPIHSHHRHCQRLLDSRQSAFRSTSRRVGSMLGSHPLALGSRHTMQDPCHGKEWVLWGGRSTAKILASHVVDGR